MDAFKLPTEKSEEEFITLTNAYDAWFLAEYMDSICNAYPAAQGKVVQKYDVSLLKGNSAYEQFNVYSAILY